MIPDLHSSPHPVASPPAYVMVSPKPTQGKGKEKEDEEMFKEEGFLSIAEYPQGDSDDIQDQEVSEESRRQSNAAFKRYKRQHPRPLEESYEWKRDADDSSDEEDIELRYNASTETALKVEELIKNHSIAPERVSALNLYLSFLAHEYGLLILNSEQVRDHYKSLKDQHFTITSILSDDQIAACIKEAVEKAFLESHGDEKKLPEEVSEKIVEEIFAKAKRSRNLFMQRVNRKEIKEIIPSFEGFMEIFPPEAGQALDNKALCQLVIDIYEEIGKPLNKNSQLERTKLKLNEQLKRLLNKYATENESPSPLKRKIAEELAKLSNNAIEVKTFISQRQRALSSYHIEHKKGHAFIDRLKVQLIRSFREKAILRSVLPSIQSITFDERYYTFPQFLAWVKLMTRSNKRILKNSINNISLFNSGEEVLIRSVCFPGLGKEAVEKQTLYTTTGSRSDFVEIQKMDNSSKYPAIYGLICNIKEKLRVNDQDIAFWIMQVLKGEGSKVSSQRPIDIFWQIELEKFLNAITYLLFGTEVARNPASLLIHYMILDLIKADALTWREAFEGLEMPMSMEKAVPAARWTHQNYDTTLKYAYDKSSPEDNASKSSSSEVEALINKEAKIFKKWLVFREIELKDGDEKSELKEKEILNLLRQSSKKWYGIDPKLESRFSSSELRFVINGCIICLNMGRILRGLSSILNIPYVGEAVYIARDRVLQSAAETGQDINICTLGISLTRSKIKDALNQYELKKEGLDIDFTQLREFLEDPKFEDDEDSESFSSEGNNQYSNEEEAKSSSGKSSSEEEMDVEAHYHFITYENPLLNDSQFFSLRSLAKAYFGMQGVNKLIDIGSDPKKYQTFSNYRKQLGDEQAIKFFLDQEPEKYPFSDIIILDPQGREVIVSDDYTQKLYSQLLHHQQTGELLEAARFAFQAGYTYRPEMDFPLSALDDFQYLLPDALNEGSLNETDDARFPSSNNFFSSNYLTSVSTFEPQNDVVPLSDEKLEAQLRYYLQNDIIYETLADYLHLDLIPTSNTTANNKNSTNALLLSLQATEIAIKLFHVSWFLSLWSSNQ